MFPSQYLLDHLCASFNLLNFATKVKKWVHVLTRNHFLKGEGGFFCSDPFDNNLKIFDALRDDIQKNKKLF